ncbi:nucleoid-associated protein [Enterococcus sp. LJL98]
MDIYLKQAILHLVDREAGDPVYSQVPLDLTAAFIRDYLIKKIQKLSTAQTKTGTLLAESKVGEMLTQATENFVAFSESFVNHWYQFYRASEDAPNSDVFIVLYEEDAQTYLAFIKVHYKEAYTHFTDLSEAGIANQLILNRAILASKSQKPDEGLTIHLETLAYELIEKKFMFSGEKRFYFSTNVIESVPMPSLDENLSVIKKAAKKMSEKFETPTYDVLANVQEAVFDTIETVGAIDTSEIAEKVFKENISARLAFQEEIKEKGFIEQAPLVKDVQEISEKKFGKQKLRLSNGIELIVPLDVYRNPDLIEFINHPDGTLSVTIKKVEDIINRL